MEGELSAPATTKRMAWMTGCRPSRCNVPDRRMSAALLTDLQVNYSVRLYGSKYRIDLRRIRILWPALLTPKAFRSLLQPGVVTCGKDPRMSSETHMFVDPPKNNLQAQAIWIHQPTLSRALLPREFAAPPSHSWVEVSHCYYSAEGGYNKIEPMWFFAAPGSGLFLNVGRTVHLDIHLGGTDEKRRERMHRALAAGNYYGLNELINGTESDLRCWKKTRAARCFKSLKSYDSMIFPLRKWRTWGHELWTEIVLLHRGAERTFVSSALDWLRCGDFPRLRKCSPTDAAVRMQGPSCIRAMDRFAPMREILSKQNCSIQNKKLGYKALQMSVEAEVRHSPPLNQNVPGIRQLEAANMIVIVPICIV
mmetsp:Transcript_34638/g.84272  ORF Transcript_34638/g.84272 Transcript_34638/m.84272 type:complete len:365 (-) Transcript_34638:513-1607(-)